MQTAILVSDCSRRGVQAVGRIAKLIEECDMHPRQIGLIDNRAPGGVLNEGTKQEIENQGLHLLGLPQTRLLLIMIVRNLQSIFRRLSGKKSYTGNSR